MEEIIKSISYITFGGILGYLIRAFIEHNLAIIRIKENIKITEFNKASAVFRATFVDEIFHIRRNAETLHDRYLERPQDIAIANEKAKIVFEVFLPDDIRSSFNNAWNKYIEANTGNHSQLTEEGRKNIADVRLSHIDNLLEFAKPKL